MKKAFLNVHRFGDRVAGYMGTGETVYLTPIEAKAFAKALNKAADSCLKEGFTKAPNLNFNLELKG